MFERFLNHTSKTEAITPKPAESVPAPSARPAPVVKPPAEPEKVIEEKSNEPLPEVRSRPMADSLNPEARPPMAHAPIQATDLPSEEERGANPQEAENEKELQSDEQEIIEEAKDESAVPEPPSFLKTPTPSVPPSTPEVDEPKAVPAEPETPEGFSDMLEDPQEEEKKKQAVKPSLKPTNTDLRVLKGPTLHETDFADIWFTPEGIAYVRDKETSFALTPIETGDLEEFHRALEQGFTGESSYAVKFGGDSYRVERVKTIDGLQYNCRKMPTTTPEIETLGFSAPIVKHMTGLGAAAGLLLFAGPTGQGKTTTASALMKRFLDKNGGFLYTIEDPPEMPLTGIYHSANGGLGLCKQVAVENNQWGAGLRSALRSRPRYILVGEIRTPETASQCLVAATSGHLVISTIHANGVEDALNSMIKYASSSGLDESLAADLLARGILGVVHQRLEGTKKLKLIYQTAFANPNPQAADQMRMTIRDKNINLSTFMEQQKARMDRGLPMFRE